MHDATIGKVHARWEMRFLQLFLTRLELTYPLKLLENQGKRAKLFGSVKERNGAIKPKRQKEGMLRQQGRLWHASLHSRHVAHSETHFRPSKLGYSPIVRDIRRFVKLGFHALFRNLNYRHGIVKIGLARRCFASHCRPDSDRLRDWIKWTNDTKERYCFIIVSYHKEFDVSFQRSRIKGEGIRGRRAFALLLQMRLQRGSGNVNY